MTDRPVVDPPGLLRVVVASAALGILMVGLLVTAWLVLAKLHLDGGLGVRLIAGWVAASLVVTAVWVVTTARTVRRRRLRPTKAWLTAVVAFTVPGVLFLAI